MSIRQEIHLRCHGPNRNPYWKFSLSLFHGIVCPEKGTFSFFITPKTGMALFSPFSSPCSDVSLCKANNCGPSFFRVLPFVDLLSRKEGKGGKRGTTYFGVKTFTTREKKEKKHSSLELASGQFTSFSWASFLLFPQFVTLAGSFCLIKKSWLWKKRRENATIEICFVFRSRFVFSNFCQRRVTSYNTKVGYFYVDCFFSMCSNRNEKCGKGKNGERKSRRKRTMSKWTLLLFLA